MLLSNEGVAMLLPLRPSLKRGPKNLLVEGLGVGGGGRLRVRNLRSSGGLVILV